MSGNEHLLTGAQALQADSCGGKPVPASFSPGKDYSGGCAIRPEDVFKNWASLGVTCDRIAHSLTPDSPDRAGFIRISMVLNELLERAIAHVVPSSQVNIETRLHDNRVAISISGETVRKAWHDLKRDFDSLNRTDLDSLYREKLRDSIMTRKVSGLDLLMLKKDFFADITISAREDLDDRIWMTINADVAL